MLRKLVAHLDTNISIVNAAKRKYKIIVPMSEINKFLIDGFEVQLHIPSFDYKLYAGEYYLHRSEKEDILKIKGYPEFYSVKESNSEFEAVLYELSSIELLKVIKEKLAINYPHK